MFKGLTVPHGWEGLTIMAEDEGRAKAHLKMASGKRVCVGTLPFIKLSDLMRLIHYHENNTGKTHPMIQLPPNRSLFRHVGIITIPGGIWVGTQSQTISHMKQVKMETRPGVVAHAYNPSTLGC